MIVVSSFSPSHTNKDNQKKALESWHLLSNEIYSMNEKIEVEILQNQYAGITFVETSKTAKFIISKPLVNINAMIDLAISLNEDLLIINSDIIIKNFPELKQDGITIFSRYDYTDTFNESKLFIHGFDVFHIPKQFLNIFPSCSFCLGGAFHDMFTPYIAMMNNIPIYYPVAKHAFHQVHEVHYDYQEWLFLGEHFRWFFKMGSHLTIPQVAQISLRKIQSKLIPLA